MIHTEELEAPPASRRPRMLPMTASGHCLFPNTESPESSHAFCSRPGCTCDCHGGA